MRTKRRVSRLSLPVIAVSAMVGAMVMISPLAATAQEQPTIAAVTTYGQVVGWDFTPSAAITVVVKAAPDGTVESTSYPTADGSGTFVVSVGDLTPGMWVSASDGTTTKDVTVVSVTLDAFDPVADTVSGTAPAGAGIRAATFNPGYVTVDTVSGPTGAWTADFTSVSDLTWLNEIEASALDDEGDATTVERRWIGNLEIRVLEDSLELSGFTADASATIDVYATSGGPRLLHKRLVTDADGAAGLGLSLNLAPGMQVTARDDVKGYVKSVVLPTASVDSIDPVTDVVTGTAPADTTFFVSLPNYDDVSLLVSSDSAGDWTADFSSIDADVTDLPWQGAELWLFNELGDQLMYEFQRPQVLGNLTTDVIEGQQLAQAATATVEVYASAGGALLWQGTVPTDNRGGFLLKPRTHHVDLVPGMQIVVDDTAATRTLTLVPLTITTFVTAAPAHSGGTANPGTDVWAGFSWSIRTGGPRHGGGFGDAWLTTADAEGDWVWTFPAPDGLPTGSVGSAAVRDADGDWTTVTYVPPKK